MCIRDRDYYDIDAYKAEILTAEPGLNSDTAYEKALLRAADEAGSYLSVFSGLDNRLAIAWDSDAGGGADGDVTTLQCNTRNGKDDYFNYSIMLAYGTYVIVEQVPADEMCIRDRYYVEPGKPVPVIGPFERYLSMVLAYEWLVSDNYYVPARYGVVQVYYWGCMNGYEHNWALQKQAMEKFQAVMNGDPMVMVYYEEMKAHILEGEAQFNGTGSSSLPDVYKRQGNHRVPDCGSIHRAYGRTEGRRQLRRFRRSPGTAFRIREG